MAHIGKTLVVMCVHGHCRTMKREKPQKLDAFWDKLAYIIIKFDVKILTGDFNMSLTQVPIELKKRNVPVTCAAWTPWIMTNGDSIHQFQGKRPHIGIDSCGIFMVDTHSNIGVKVQWGPDSIDPITGAVVPPQSAVADDAGTAFRRELHAYNFGCCPGQHWT